MTVVAAMLEWREHDGLRWLQWEAAGVAAAFPTREGRFVLIIINLNGKVQPYQIH